MISQQNAEPAEQPNCFCWRGRQLDMGLRQFEGRRSPVPLLPSGLRPQAAISQALRVIRVQSGCPQQPVKRKWQQAAAVQEKN